MGGLCKPPGKKLKLILKLILYCDLLTPREGREEVNNDCPIEVGALHNSPVNGILGVVSRDAGSVQPW